MRLVPLNRHILLFLALCLLFAVLKVPQSDDVSSSQLVTAVLAGESQPLRDQEILLIDSQHGSITHLRSDSDGRVSLPAQADQARLLYPLADSPDMTKRYLHGSLQAGTLAFNPQQLLTTFPVTISLEWQPGNNGRDLASLEGCRLPSGAQASYLEDLAQAMRSAAAYLYDVSEGQMTFGDVTIYTGGEHWNDADIRILANNNYRPSALIGGYVSQTTTISNADKSLNLRLRPGQILLGRQWDGQSGACGPWSSPAGVRTIVHEWMHYALNLWDEYLKPLEGRMSYCSNDNLPAFQTDVNQSSMMAYHYTSNALWGADVANHGLAVVPENCRDTDQMLVHNRSDWETIAFYFPTIKMPDLKEGQRNQAYDASELRVKLPDLTSAPAQTNAQVTISIPNEKLLSENYLIMPRSANDPLPKRMIGQGVLSNKVPSSFLGVLEGQTLRSLAIDPVSNVRHAFPLQDSNQDAAAIKAAEGQSFELQAGAWQTEIMLVPQFNRLGDVSSLELVFQECEAETREVQAVYCPAGGDCSEPVSATSSNGVFIINLSKPGETIAFHGYIYIRDPNTGRWTATWYQLGGGVGPAHADGHTPMADGLVSVNVPMGSLDAGDSYTATLYMPAQRCSMPEPDESLGGPILPPLELVIVRGNRLWNNSDPRVNIHVAYDPRLIGQLGYSVNDLNLLSYTPGRNRINWADTPIMGRNSRLGLLSIDRDKANSADIVFAGRSLLSLGVHQQSGPDQNHRLLLPYILR